MATPQHREMSRAVGLCRDEERRKGTNLREQQVIDRHDHLFAVEVETDGKLLQRVDRRAVDRRLASLAQPPVARRDPEAL